MTWLVRLATVGVRIRGWASLPREVRAGVFAWLARGVPRYGRSRTMAAIAAVVLIVAAAAFGLLAALPFYMAEHEAYWGSRAENLSELADEVFSGRVAIYYGVLVWQTGFTVLFVAVGAWLWLFLGSKAALLNRRRCIRCRHDLSGQAVVAGEARCAECGSTLMVVDAWDETKQTGDRCVFRPAEGLVRVFWDHRRIVLAARGLAAALVLSAMIWGGVWTYRRVDSNLQASAARAARLQPTTIAAKLSEGTGPTAPRGGPRRSDLIRALSERIKALETRFSAEISGANNAYVLGTTFGDEAATAETSAEAEQAKIHLARLFAMAEEGGLVDALDELVTADPFDEPRFIPHDASEAERSASLGYLGATRAVHRFNRYRLRSAVAVGDLAAFRLALASDRALREGRDNAQSLFSRMVVAMQWRDTLKVLDDVVRRHRDGEWLDTVQAHLLTFESADLLRLVENERLMYLDVIAAHFSDAARIRRGLNDDFMTKAVWLSSEAEERPLRLGSFAENLKEVNAAFDGVIAALGRRPWSAARYSAWNARSVDLWFIKNGSLTTGILAENDRTRLATQGVSLATKIARWQMTHGRLPANAEYAELFSGDADAVDPFSGQLFGYRTSDLSGVDAERGFMLWSVGLDGVDDGGATVAERLGLLYTPPATGDIRLLDLLK